MHEVTTIPELIARLSQAEIRAARRIAQLVVESQLELIAARETPDGGTQKRNAPLYEKIKHGKPPLYHRGVLADASQWRVKISKAGTAPKVDVLPPLMRAHVVRFLEDAGFETIFGELPDDVRVEASRILAEELAKG